jgi:hypothetical protein
MAQVQFISQGGLGEWYCHYCAVIEGTTECFVQEICDRHLCPITFQHLSGVIEVPSPAEDSAETCTWGHIGGPRQIGDRRRDVLAPRWEWGLSSITYTFARTCTLLDV